MNHRPDRPARLFIGLFASVILTAGPGRASAGLLVQDSYTIGSGGYTAGLNLRSQPSVGATGFLAGSIYNMGSGTSNYFVNSGGLAATDPSTAGHVSFDGVSDNAIRANARAFSTIAPSSTYWFSMTVSQDGSSAPLASNPVGYALAGFGNSTPPVLGFTTTNGAAGATPAYLQGLFFGFAHEATDPAGDAADLVIRARNSIGYTSGDSILLSNAAANTSYTIIAQLNVNVNGTPVDNLTYWVNPTDLSSVAAMDSTSLVTNDGSPVATYAFQTAADFARLTYSAQAWNGDTSSANFGDPTMGTTLADVAPSAIPEPTSIVMAGIGLVGGLGLAIRRHRALA